MSHKLQPILARTAAPFFVFSVVLLGCLGLIRVAVVPLLTRIEVDGKPQQLTTLLQKHAALTASLAEAETKRSALVLPVQDPTYIDLRTEQQLQQRLQALIPAVAELLKQAERDGKPVVTVQTISLDLAARTLRIRGDVRNSDQSSVSVLAWFIDSLRSVPLLADTPTPEFERKEDPYIGIYSPYDIVIPLRVHE